MLKTKWVRAPIDRQGDGLRILATRGLGRGLRKNRYDVWMANLGPSEQSRLTFQRDGRWAEYKRRYIAELFGKEDPEERNKRIKNRGQKFTLRLIRELARKGNVTLLCHCEKEEFCHRRVLKEVIESTRI